MGTHHLTISQQVWLAAYTAALQSAKYHPANEADDCLKKFNEKFIPEVKKQLLLEADATIAGLVASVAAQSKKPE
jgi:hypothetical protein